MLEGLAQKPTRLIIGLTSGTSAEGIDGALVSVNGRGTDFGLRVHAHVHLGFADRVRKMILAASEAGSGRVDSVCRIDGLLGELLAQAAFRTAEKAGLGMEQVDLIASHGLTVHHLPKPERIAGVDVTSTLQVGHPAIIAERTGVTTVADFRARDMAAGGQGGPLVAYTDFLLFRHRARGRLVLNLGGIANITALPPGCNADEVMGFDTGPGTMASDMLVRRLTGDRVHYDPEGRYALEGQVSRRLLDRLLDHPYLDHPPPKTCGREQFGARFVDAVLQDRGEMGPEDLIATVTRFSAAAIARAYLTFIAPHGSFEEMVLAGGGARNRFLLRSLEELLPGLSPQSSDDYGIPAAAKEAVAYALLANETIHLQAGNLPRTTGAAHPVVLGCIVPGRP